MRFSWQLKDLRGTHTQTRAAHRNMAWKSHVIGLNFRLVRFYAIFLDFPHPPTPQPLKPSTCHPNRCSLKRFQLPGPGKCQSFANLWLLTIFIIGIINNTIMPAEPGALSLFAVCPSALQLLLATPTCSGRE